MKGGYNGLGTKQLFLFLMAVFCTSILLFGWAKSPIFSSLIPPVFEDPQDILEEGLNDSNAVNKRVDLQDPDNNADNNFITDEAVEEGEEKQPVEEASDPNVVSKRINLQEPDHFASNNTITTGSVMTEETTEKAMEVSHGQNSSKYTEDIVAPFNFASTNISLAGRESNLLTSRGGIQDCNYAKGKWITGDNRPLYSGFGCKTWLLPMWSCRLTQCTDFEYEKLRWQPKDCKMQDFTSSNFLKRQFQFLLLQILVHMVVNWPSSQQFA